MNSFVKSTKIIFRWVLLRSWIDFGLVFIHGFNNEYRLLCISLLSPVSQNPLDLFINLFLG